MFQIEKVKSLSENNTLGVTSSAAYYACVTEKKELLEYLAWAKQNDVPIGVLAEGSNVLLAPSINGLVINPALLGKTVVERNETNVLIDVGAGENWHAFTQWCLDQQFFGLENLSLIPGSVGASPIQNIGAYGVEVSSYIEYVDAINMQTGEQARYTKAECLFSYRESVFKTEAGHKNIIVNVGFRLSLNENVNLTYPALKAYFQLDKNDSLTAHLPSARDVANAIIEIRSKKLPDPKHVPNVGSFFKNPVVDLITYLNLQQRFGDVPSFDVAEGHKKIPAAWLIDHAGWKQKQSRRVRVHNQQALVVINPDHCDLNSVLAFAAEIQQDIAQKYQISLEIEPQQLRMMVIS